MEFEKIVLEIREKDELGAFMTLRDCSIEVIQCDVCGRLWVDKNNDRHFIEYVKADSNSEML